MSRKTRLPPQHSSSHRPDPENDGSMGESDLPEEPSALGNLFIAFSLISSLSFIVGLLFLLASRPSLPVVQDSCLPTQPEALTSNS